MKNKKIKVALINPPLAGHQKRGTGVYLDNLYKRLSKMSNVKCQMSNVNNIPSDIDTLHFPYFDPFFLTFPWKRPAKTVVTVHDLIPLVFPDKYPRGIKGEIKWQIQKWKLKQVDAIITDSNSSKKDIVRIIGSPEKKVHVVYLAASNQYQKLNIKNQKHILKIKNKYNLGNKFILYVGDVNWNKNIAGLIKAFSTIKQYNNITIKLVLIGETLKNKKIIETQKILSLIKKLHLQNNVRILGSVPEDDLVKIYNSATVYVQPSFYEGFGLPVLEAMACGTPVIVSKTSSLPEIVGTAAIFVNPYDLNDIANAIKKIIDIHTTEYGKYKQLTEKALKQAKKFSWQKTTEQTVKVYQKMML